jgi:hypothetical protein
MHDPARRLVEQFRSVMFAFERSKAALNDEPAHRTIA